MASLWDNLIGRARAAPAPRAATSPAPRVSPLMPPRRYLAVVARERPDLLARVNRLFRTDGNVEAVLDRRHGERRRPTSPPAGAPRPGGFFEDRRRADRREARQATDLAAGLVVIAEASASALPVRLARWLAAGRDVLGSLDRVVEDLAALERQCEALRATVHRLQAENQALRARDAAISRELAGLADEIARPLGEIVHRLRGG